VAYDLLFRKRTRTNWSRHSYCGPRGILLLASTTYEFAPDPTPTTDEEKQFIAKLAVLKMSADAGNKKASKEWKATLTKLEAVKKKAAKGDEKSKHLVVVLQESGIFDGVQAMSVTGDDKPFDPAPLEKLLKERMAKIELLAKQGDPAAIKSVSFYQRQQNLGKSLFKAINDDMVERASKGDSEAKRWLVERDRRLPIGKKIDVALLGDDNELTGCQEARKILDAAAQSKSIARADLKRAIWLHAGKQSTEVERAAVGSKMLDFLNKRQIKFSA